MAIDRYTLIARLKPALLTGLPLALAVVAWFQNELLSSEIIWVILVYCGVSILLSQIVRDIGKQEEQGLFDMWGGAPTTIQLRFRNAKDKALVSHFHKKLNSLFPDVNLLSETEEIANPLEADQEIKRCVLFLREATRDKNKFCMIYEENISYGFRRNLWALKPIGILISCLGILAISLRIWFVWSNTINPMLLVLAGLNLLILLGWIFIIDRDWVRIVADEYAARLIGASNIISKVGRNPCGFDNHPN